MIFFSGFAEAPFQRLFHGGVIIATGDAFDVVTAVVGLESALGGHYHAGGDRRFTQGVADVEAFQSCRDAVQLKQFLEVFKTFH